MEKTKPLTFLLWLLLLVSIAGNIYQYNSSPIKNYNLLYGSDTSQYQLYVRNEKLMKDTSEKWTGSGRRIKFKEGQDFIRKYRQSTMHNDAATKYVSFTFDSVFTYMGYILTEYKPRMNRNDTLGFRVFFGQDTLLSEVNHRMVYKNMVLLAPTTNKKIPKFVDDGEYDFFDQGSICPIICPGDIKDVDPPPAQRAIPDSSARSNQ